MSTIVLSPNASGTGNFTIAAPNSNTNRTLTLPDATGTVNTSGAVNEVPAGSASAPSVYPTGDTNTGEFFPAADTIAWTTGGSERMRVDSSGNVGIGTSSPGNKLYVYDTSNPDSPDSTVKIYGERAGSANLLALRAASPGGTALNDGYGTTIRFQGYDGSVFRNMGAIVVNASGANVSSTTSAASMLFYTTPASSTTLTERARITSGGTLLIGKTTDALGTAGFTFLSGASFDTTVSADKCIRANRLSNDGNLVEFAQDTTVEGTISVSGTTVSYNAFAGSHWSQLQDGSKPEILRGTVMESIDELCEWPDEPQSERLCRAKISDTAGSKKVYGVFMCWDEDWTATNDMMVTSLGAFVCRVNADVVVQQGDLLESNGDGTARVQADDIVRSSTIGKVTSTVKTHEHPDGSYCVPTVLYCG